MGQEDSRQTEVLFSEINLLIKKCGLHKAIAHIRSLNKYKGKVMDDVSTYEFIIVTVIEVFGITETQLYKANEKFKATDARRTSYVLLNKYLKYSYSQIGAQFGKAKSTISMAMSEFDRMSNDRAFFGDYIKKHEEIENRVIGFVNTMNAKIPKKKSDA